MFGIGANIDQYLAVAYLLREQNPAWGPGAKPRKLWHLRHCRAVMETISYDQFLAVACFCRLVANSSMGVQQFTFEEPV